jgi:hypothetical protein
MNLKDLKKPFPESDIEWRVGSVTKDNTKGTALAYLTNRAIMDRLDEVIGAEHWRNEFREWKGGQLCGISIKVNDEWVTKWDGADDSKIEPTKGGLSDAMKRAAVQWGIGRYLYSLETSWVALDEYKHIKNVPSLPAWALPEGAMVKETKKQEPRVDQNALLTKEQQKGLWDFIVKKHGEEHGKTCVDELKAMMKISKLAELKMNDITACNEFIVSWDSTALPFTLTDK